MATGAQPQSPFHPNCLSSLVVLVTGGGSGIGLGISAMFAAHGARIIVFGRRARVLEEAARSLRERWPSCMASACRGDVRDADSCAAAVAACVREHGRLDVLVNCAAGNFMCAAEELTPTAFRTVVDIDLQGTYNMCSAALGALSGERERPATAGSPLIINISATLHYKALPFQAHACAAKAGIDALTRTLGLEYGAEHGVRVVGIAPGPIAGTEGGPTGRVFGAAIAGQAVKDLVPLARCAPPARLERRSQLSGTHGRAWLRDWQGARRTTSALLRSTCRRPQGATSTLRRWSWMVGTGTTRRAPFGKGGMPFGQ